MSELPALRVLVVEDHPVNRGLLARQLGLLGCQVEAVADAETALEAWRRSRHDLVLTDLNLPGIDGAELVRRLRSETADRGEAPVIIAITGTWEPERQAPLQAAGVDQILVKPVDLHELRAILMRWQEGEPDRVPKAIAKPVQPAALPVAFDRRVLSELLGEAAGEDSRRLVQLFLDNAMQGLAEAEASLADRDRERLRQFLHRQRSAAAAVGALGFVDQVLGLELALREGDWDTLERQWPRLHEALSSLERMLRGRDAKETAMSSRGTHVRGRD
ncbi:hybrid sensor histidine kinase/response regulator [Thioalkalivibrio sulfidiphilus]|uniref:response regulator n=1 Tax=Thioalkalivibrio sulfidiphilus TaxID=1033854 RepID=UPI000377F50A|nr:response regulator [Thioalkalivibrio sulfidiphilus]